MNSRPPVYDPLIHPAFLDPRQWGDVNVYSSLFKVEREPIAGSDHFAPDREFRIQHLCLDLRFDLDAGSVAGKATLTVVAFNDGLAAIELDAAEMSIAQVRRVTEQSESVDSPLIPLGGLSLNLPFVIDRERLIIELDQKMMRQEPMTIEIEYSCRPRKGLYFIRPDTAYAEKPRQIWSQGQTEDAHWWFPCVDTPHQKMTTELIATIDQRYEVLSNGVLVSKALNPGTNTATFHWRQEQPHPAYLVTVVAGEYQILQDRLRGLPVDYYVYPSQAEEGRVLFSQTPQMIEFFGEKFGYPYPFAKYSQVLVHDFLFGAMENTSATTMTDRCLLDERARLDLSYEDIVAHELAHHWFGDLVTCKHWSEIWLNESFATYAEYLWREHTLGEDQARLVLFQDFLTYLNEDFSSHRRPIVSNRYRYSEELMDRHAYEKGACVLHMLRSLLGDDAFFRSLARHLNKGAFGVAETGDLKAAIEEVTGRNLHWFFDQWVYKPGYPELEVKYEWQREHKTIRLQVKQVQKTSGEDVAAAFRFPVEVEILTIEGGAVLETDDAERRFSYHIWIEKEEQEFYFPCETTPRLVTFDKGHRIFKLMTFPKSWQELTWQLRYDHDFLGRMAAARDLVAYRTPETGAALRDVAAGNDLPQVRAAAAIALGELEDYESRDTLIAIYRQSDDPQVRRSCVWALGAHRREAGNTVTFLREVIQSDPSYFAAIAAVHALAKIGSENEDEAAAAAAYEAICTALEKKSWQDVLPAAVFSALKHTKNRRAIGLAYEHLRYGQPPAVRVAAIAYLGVIGKELAAEKLDEPVLQHLTDLLSDPAVRVRVAAVRALGKIANPKALQPLEEARKRECLDMLKAALEDAIEGIRKK